MNHMRHVGFQIKLSIIFIAIIVAVLLLTSFFIYERAIGQQKEELRTKILSMAKLASMLIDVDKHSQIKAESESQNTTFYKEIQAVLNKIKRIDPVIDSVYTMVKSETKNIWIFVVDSGDKRGVTAYCGERYDVSSLPEMQLAFDRPSVDKELSRDKWGVFLSGYAPLYNKDGLAVAIIGIDVRAESIRNMQLLLARRFFGVLILGIIFSLLLGWFVSKKITEPLGKLTLFARKVGEGSFREKVVVKTGDELEELADAFNKMVAELEETQVKLQRYYLDTIKSLARALEAKDPYTRGHSERVMRYAVNIARRLQLSEKDVDLLVELCIMHDVGKIGVPEKILTKPGPLTEEEWQIVKMHPKIGEDILKHVEFLEPGLTIIRHHHERPDGKGYPDGINIDEISILVSIVAVADAFDAMTSDRPYRLARTKEEAISILKENKGKQFNSRVVDVFLDYLTEK